jgi:hypothetical protein
MVMLIDERQYAKTEMIGLLSSRDKGSIMPGDEDEPLKDFLDSGLGEKRPFSLPGGLLGTLRT